MNILYYHNMWSYHVIIFNMIYHKMIKIIISEIYNVIYHFLSTIYYNIIIIVYYIIYYPHIVWFYSTKLVRLRLNLKLEVEYGGVGGKVWWSFVWVPGLLHPCKTGLWPVPGAVSGRFGHLWPTQHGNICHHTVFPQFGFVEVVSPVSSCHQ